jgi:Ca2+-binding RTX toxin-like protein
MNYRRYALLLAAAVPALAGASETVTYSYDSQGRLLHATRPSTSGVNPNLDYAYAFDRADNRLSKTVSGSTGAVPGSPTAGADLLWGTYGADTIDGLDGGDLIYAQLGGNDTIYGGNGSDAVLFCAAFAPGDSVDGGAGSDQVALQGNYPNLVLWATALTNVETLALLPGSDARFGCQSGDSSIGYSYNVTLVDSNIAAGVQMTVNAATLSAGETMTLNASAETNGSVRVFGGAGADTITGSSGADFIRGLGGADTLTGGPGGDIFSYIAGESSGAAYDRLIGFDESQDRIDLPGTIIGFASPVTGASLSSASFESDLAAAVGSALTAGKAMTVTASSGTLAGHVFLVADGNGVAGFQAGADYVFEIVLPATPISGSVNFFV